MSQTSETFQLRPAEPRDVPGLITLITGLAQYENLTTQLEVTPERLTRDLFGPRPAAEALVAHDSADQARLLGFALFFANYSTFLGKPGLYLEDLFVVPEARGRGVGRALISAVARLALERDCGRFEWSVLDWNKSAIGFYTGLGATILPDWRVCRLTGPALERFRR
ncbi:MAG: GNAT family N-acetyltransferase [Polyangiales bacterium]